MSSTESIATPALPTSPSTRDGPSHSPDEWPDQRQPKDPADQQRDFSVERLDSSAVENLRTGAPSRGDLHTWLPWGHAYRAQSPASCLDASGHCVFRGIQRLYLNTFGRLPQ